MNPTDKTDPMNIPECEGCVVRVTCSRVYDCEKGKTGYIRQLARESFERLSMIAKREGKDNAR